MDTDGGSNMNLILDTVLNRTMSIHSFSVVF